MKKYLVVFSLMIAGYLLAPLIASPALAQGVDIYGGDVCSGENASSDFCAKRDDTDITEIIRKGVNVLLFIVGVISVFVLIYAGVIFSTSKGNPENITKGKQIVVYAIVGLAIAVFAYAIINWVVRAFS